MSDYVGSGLSAQPRSTLRAQVASGGSASKSDTPRAKRYYRPRGTKALPDGVIWAGRGSLWANPFFGRQWGHAKSVILHRRWLPGEIACLSLDRMGFSAAEVEALFRLRIRVLTNLWRLAGHDLACSCPLSSRWCHVDAVLDLVPLHADYERFAA